LSKLSETLLKEPGGVFFSSLSFRPTTTSSSLQPAGGEKQGIGPSELAPGSPEHSKAKHPIRFLGTRLFHPCLPYLTNLDCPPQLLSLFSWLLSPFPAVGGPEAELAARLPDADVIDPVG